MAQMIKHLAYNAGDLGSIPGKILWRGKWQPTPVLLLGKSHGQRSMVGYSPQGRKESDTTEQLNFIDYFPACISACLLEKKYETKSILLNLYPTLVIINIGHLMLIYMYSYVFIDLC